MFAGLPEHNLFPFSEQDFINFATHTSAQVQNVHGEWVRRSHCERCNMQKIDWHKYTCPQACTITTLTKASSDIINHWAKPCEMFPDGVSAIPCSLLEVSKSIAKQYSIDINKVMASALAVVLAKCASDPDIDVTKVLDYLIRISNFHTKESKNASSDSSPVY